MLLPQSQQKSKFDCIFVNELRKIVSDKEIIEIVEIIETEGGVDIKDSERLELFFQKVKKELNNSMYDSVVCMCNSFNLDVDNILDKTYIFDKIRAELKPIGRDLKKAGIF